MTAIGIRHRQAPYNSGSFAELRLPFPPPLTACYTNNGRRGRVKTQRYRAWEQRAWLAMRGKPEIKGRVSIAIQATPPDRRKRDLDNLLKPTLDVLSYRGCIIEDDSLVEALFIKWVREGEPGLAVMVTSMPEPT